MAAPNMPGISQNLLRNFNPYDILKPQRNGEPQIERLIDIGEETSAEVDASFLDQKQKYELVDLFQNIYVTPEHIQRNNSISTLEEECSNEINYKDFFDKLESGEKIDGTDTLKESKQNEYVNMERKSRVLIPKVDLDDSEPDEDLIDEVLANKNVEKCMLDQINSLNGIIDANKQDRNVTDNRLDLPRPKVLKAPTDIDFIEANLIEKNKTATNNKLTSIEQTVGTKFAAQSEICRLNLNNNLTTNKNEPAGVKLDAQIQNEFDFKVLAIKKDEKVFKKKRIIKPECQTCNFTKGADIDEKSVVLPQMMARIMARQADIEARNNLKRRFVLDAGVKPVNNLSNLTVANRTGVKNPNDNKKNAATDKKAMASNTTDNTWGKVNPIVLMADCNKERLKAFKQGRMFQNFVMNGQ